MGESRKVKILLSLIFVLLIGIGSLVYSYYNPKVREDSEDEVKGEYVITGVPYIITVPPIVAYEGEEYVYFLRVVDSDTSIKELKLEITEGPSWLELDDLVLRGTPPSGSSGTYDLILKVSDGSNSSVQRGYIIVEEEYDE